MKSNVYDAKDLAELVEQHNPFGIKGNDGSILFFESYAAVYFHVLVVLHTQFKRGYVDLILLINVLTQVGASVCEELFRNMRSLWGSNPEKLIMYNFDSTDDDDHADLALIMKCLHVISETKFDAYQFREAIQLMQIKLAKEAQP